MEIRSSPSHILISAVSSSNLSSLKATLLSSKEWDLFHSTPNLSQTPCTSLIVSHSISAVTLLIVFLLHSSANKTQSSLTAILNTSAIWHHIPPFEHSCTVSLNLFPWMAVGNCIFHTLCIPMTKCPIYSHRAHPSTLQGWRNRGCRSGCRLTYLNYFEFLKHSNRRACSGRQKWKYWRFWCHDGE